MTMNEINRAYTAKVAEYISKGYIINSSTMAGTQGEIAKIDLVKDNELIRVYLEIEHAYGWNDSFYGNILYLRVGRWKREANSNCTVWMSELDILEEKSYYNIGRDSNWYIEDYDEAVHTVRMRSGRLERQHIRRTREDITSEATQEIAIRYLKRKVKYQRVSRDKIRVYKETDNRYTIKYNDTSYSLN